MATTLHPTPTRLALLRAIANPNVKVYQQRPLNQWEPVSYHHAGAKLVVTAKVAELEQARWIKLGSADHPSMYAPRPWELTDLGRQVLAAADSKEKRT